MANITVLQHVPFEGPAAIGQWLEQRGHTLTLVQLYQPHALPKMDELDWLVVMGGPMGVGDEAQYPFLAAEKTFIRQAIDSNKVVLGICLGAQLIADVLGATVSRHPHREIGWFPVRNAGSHHPLARLFDHAPTVLHWHGDRFAIPDQAEHLLASDGCANQAFLYQHKVLGLQFHLECSRASLTALCDACADELIGDNSAQANRWLQTRAQILGTDAPFQSASQLLNPLLGYLEQQLA